MRPNRYLARHPIAGKMTWRRLTRWAGRATLAIPDLVLAPNPRSRKAAQTMDMGMPRTFRLPAKTAVCQQAPRWGACARRLAIDFSKSHPSGAKGHLDFGLDAARVNSRPVTKLTHDGVFPQPLQQCPFAFYPTGRVFFATREVSRGRCRFTAIRRPGGR